MQTRLEKLKNRVKSACENAVTVAAYPLAASYSLYQAENSGNPTSRLLSVASLAVTLPLTIISVPVGVVSAVGRSTYEAGAYALSKGEYQENTEVIIELMQKAGDIFTNEPLSTAEIYRSMQLTVPTAPLVASSYEDDLTAEKEGEWRAEKETDHTVDNVNPSLARNSELTIKDASSPSYRGLSSLAAV